MTVHLACAAQFRKLYWTSGMTGGPWGSFGGPLGGPAAHWAGAFQGKSSLASTLRTAATGTIS